MAHFFDQLSKTLHEATQELLDMFAINIESKNTQTGSDIRDTDD